MLYCKHKERFAKFYHTLLVKNNQQEKYHCNYLVSDILRKMLPDYFIIIGTLIGAVGSIGYILDTIKGRAKPNRVSFLLWAIAPIVAFTAQIGQGVGLESLMTFSTGFFPLLIFTASFINKQAEWKITRFDVICGALSLVGLVLWYVTKVGNVAIFFSIIADGLAALPTLVKAYKYPDTEVAWPWFMTSIGIVLTLLTLHSITFANAGFISYIFLMNILITALIYFRLGEKLKFK